METGGQLVMWLILAFAILMLLRCNCSRAVEEGLLLKCPHAHRSVNRGVAYDGGLRDQLADSTTIWGSVGSDST